MLMNTKDGIVKAVGNGYSRTYFSMDFKQIEVIGFLYILESHSIKRANDLLSKIDYKN